MQLTLADLRARVRSGLGEPSNSSRLTTTVLDWAINNAYAAVARDGRCFRRTTTRMVEITSITGSEDVVTVVTTTDHNLVADEVVVIAGTTGGTPSFNGTFPIKAITPPKTFTYDLVGASGTDDTGTVTVPELKTTATQELYTLPDDITDFLIVYVEGASRPLQRCTQEDLDAWYGLWQEKAAVGFASITHVYDAGHGKIGLYPPPSEDDKAIVVTGHCVPTGTSSIAYKGGYSLLATAEGIPALDSYFHEMIVWKAMDMLANTRLLDSEAAQVRGRWASDQYSRLVPLLAKYPLFKVGLLSEAEYLQALAAALSIGR